MTRRQLLFAAATPNGTPGFSFSDITASAGLRFHHNTGAFGSKYLPETMGPGCAFIDYDADGWPDILLATGSVYPEVEKDLPAYPYRTIPLMFRNLGNGKYEQLIEMAGPAMLERHSSRGSAFGDFDNDGDVDVVMWNRNEPPSLLRNDLKSSNHWLQVRLRGTASNRSAIGARVTLEFAGRKSTQVVLSQSSFYSASDLRLHFGLGAATGAAITVKWPSGRSQVVEVDAVDRILEIVESK